MGRVIKRVPLDFDWPLNKIWYGYLHHLCSENCDDCKHYASLKGLSLTEYGCPDFHLDPPTGEGYQLWETTTEGSPISPVFDSPEELAAWCALHATIFGSETMDYEQWLRMIHVEDSRLCGHPDPPGEQGEPGIKENSKNEL